MIEYAVPVHWEQCTDEELKQLQLQLTMEANKDDINMFGEMGLAMTLSGDPQQAGATNVVIKQEKDDSGGHSATINKVAAFQTGIEAVFKEFQSLELDMKQIKARSDQGNHKYTEGVAQDAEALGKKIGEFYKIIESMIMNPDGVGPSKIPDVIRKKDALLIEVGEVKTWAAKFGLVVVSGSKRKRKTD